MLECRVVNEQCRSEIAALFIKIITILLLVVQQLNILARNLLLASSLSLFSKSILCTNFKCIRHDYFISAEEKRGGPHSCLTNSLKAPLIFFDRYEKKTLDPISIERIAI